ncbi:MAG: PIN domain-containing protein [Thermoleophilia bacterium]
MSAVTVDASVWVAAADASDPRCDVSRTFLAEVGRRGFRLVVPAIVLVEVGCALARRSRDAEGARRLTQATLAPDFVSYVPVDGPLLARSLREALSSRGVTNTYREAMGYLPTPGWRREDSAGVARDVERALRISLRCR